MPDSCTNGPLPGLEAETWIAGDAANHSTTPPLTVVLRFAVAWVGVSVLLLMAMR
jgi:hypothetical protein